MTEEALKKIASLYSAMDAAYDEVAGRYNVSCGDCDDNCCTQRFYHYTLAEYLYLLEGVKQLPAGKRDLIFRRAKVVTESYAHEMAAGEVFKLMCPANFEGLCSLYEWRPMICRLHGVPHHFRMPDGTDRTGGGCHRIGEGALPGMDRTPFYRTLAEIEKELREGLNYRQCIKKTTAQMLFDMAFELDIDGM